MFFWNSDVTGHAVFYLATLEEGYASKNYLKDSKWVIDLL